MLNKISIILVIGLVMFCPLVSRDQQKDLSPLAQVIAAGNDTMAAELLNKEVQYFIEHKNFDTLAHYVSLTGQIEQHRGGNEKAAIAVFAFIDHLKTNAVPATNMIGVCRGATQFFQDISEDAQAYKASQQALTYSLLAPGRDSLQVARSEYNLGVCLQRLGDVNGSAYYQRKAYTIRKASPNVLPEDLYMSCNGMGTMMWYNSKYDSAGLYFNQALAVLASMPDNDLNKYYRSANVNNNLAALYSANGKTSDAMSAMQKTIQDFQQFLASPQPHPKKKDALSGLFQAIDNLAGVYQEIGDYGKNGELLLYSYQQKKQKLDATDPDIFISEILLGQYYNAINEYDHALDYLNSGLAKLEKSKGDYLFWQADGNYGKAIAFENKKLDDSAAFYYSKSQSLYEESYQGDYDNIYMDFLRHASLFYADNGHYAEAKANAGKVYDYLVKVKQDKGLQAFYQLLNIAEIEYRTAHYEGAMQQSRYALALVNKMVSQGATLLDSAKIEVFKPRAALIQAKAGYQLQKIKSVDYLKTVAAQLDNALHTLEKRKVLLDDAGSINILMSDNAELIDFAKKIQLELYETTGDENYLDGFINLHESGIYNRIRSNLDKEKAIRFANLPEAVQQEEQQLKAAIPASLQTGGDNTSLMNGYMQAVQRWDEHLDNIRNHYPAYYAMRYASIVKHLPQLQQTIPAQTTLVRYFFNDSTLLALVADSTHKQLIHLESAQLAEKIKTALDPHTGEQDQLVVLYELYTQIWKPLAPAIHTKKVIIIPDGILYNVGFDMLQTKPASSFETIASNSLLAGHVLSYHYSLFMLDQPVNNTLHREDYIAFVPGFSDDIKNEYRNRVKDSVNLDYQYLSLLPQPNTSTLAEKIKDQLHGEAYMNNASTEQSFVQNAAGHKIIHIGTHAEYNNSQPERSRLIFAKNITAVNDTNSLYLSDIYNCNMSADLTILTACESGRPGFRDGEGMVSLAHAFNYAGSNMILTGLWKLDEQSSNIITDFFIQNLIKKMPAEEALQQAKLMFLAQAKGRMKAPAYWAGIVLMGKPGVIVLNDAGHSFPWLWVIVSGALAVLTILWLSRKKISPRPSVSSL